MNLITYCDNITVATETIINKLDSEIIIKVRFQMSDPAVNFCLIAVVVVGSARACYH